MSAARWPAGVLAGWLVLAACGVSPQRAPEQVPPDRLPEVAPHQSADVAQARVWVARRGRLVPVFVELRKPGLPGRLDALLALSSAEPTPPTATPAGTRLLSISGVSGDVVRIRLSAQLLTGQTTGVTLALAQLVLTATEEPDVRAVEVRVGDRPVTIADARDRPIQRPLRRVEVAAYAHRNVD